MTTAELIAMSEYSSVHTIGNTGPGGWIAGLTRARYQGLFTPPLPTEPSTAAAPTAAAVPAKVFLIICEMTPLDERAHSPVGPDSCSSPASRRFAAPRTERQRPGSSALMEGRGHFVPGR